jgi:hypothetical protein
MAIASAGSRVFGADGGEIIPELAVAVMARARVRLGVISRRVPESSLQRTNQSVRGPTAAAAGGR